MKEEKGKGGQLSEELKRLRQRVAELEQVETERKQAEEALRESEEKYRTLVEQSLQGIVVVQGFRIVFANTTFTEISGYTVEELLSFLPEEVQAMIHPEDQAFVWGHFRDRLAGKLVSPRYEYRGIGKDGAVRWLEMFASRIEYRGKPAIQGAIVDITERKWAEEQLQSEKEKFRVLVEESPLGVSMIGKDGHYKYFNSKFIEIFGYTLEDIPTGREWFAKAYPDQEYRNQAISTWINDLKKAKHGSSRPRTFTVRCKDGSEKVIYFRPVTMEVGDQFVIYEDITERKQAEVELRHSYRQLRETLISAVNALASAVEMRDPYTAGHQRRVTQLACAIAKEMGLPEEQIEGLRMAGLIHDIGKINVPAEILSKPSPLPDIEFSLIRVHPQAAYDILEAIDFPWPVAQIVLQHHERVNGSGYPKGIKGEEMLLEARILAVADVVEAMSSHRPYRPAHSLDEALEEISQKQGALYDPEVAEACLRLFAEDRFHFEE